VKQLLVEMTEAYLTLGRRHREVEEELEKVCEQKFLKKEREGREESNSSSSSARKVAGV